MEIRILNAEEFFDEDCVEFVNELLAYLYDEKDCLMKSDSVNGHQELHVPRFDYDSSIVWQYTKENQIITLKRIGSYG
jgi:mRNA-degrading endonuclease YafQ of YafQ-DinJ toxin-antitoxin module